MSNLIAVLFLLSMITIVVGIINPRKALFFIPKSKRNKKNAIIIFGTIFLLIVLASFLGVGITSDNTNIVEKETTKEVEKSIDDIIKEKVMEVTSEKDDRTITIDIKDNENKELEEKIVLVEISGNNTLTRDEILKENKEIFEKLSDIEEVLEVITLNNYPIVDEYGEVNDEVALKVEMTRESLDEIRWENFEHENLKDVADEYFENPKLENKK